MLNELATALKRFEEDKDAAVAIINGVAGNFSIGYDIEELKAKERLDADDFIVRNYMTNESQKNPPVANLFIFRYTFSFHFNGKLPNH